MPWGSSKFFNQKQDIIIIMTKAILFEVLVLLLETFIIWLYKKLNNKETTQSNHQTAFEFA
jgi:hypothetical protein